MRCVLILLVVCLSFVSFAQRVTNFELFLAGTTKVNAKFTLRAGSTCFGYKIMHSTDSINYQEVIDYPGICGSSGSDEYFSNTHETPTPNVTNYYKVQLSTFETSEVRRIFVGVNKSPRMLVFPNPIYSNTDVATVKLIGTNNTKVIGFIYDQFGNVKQYLDLTTKVDLTTINVGSLDSGLYVIWYTDGSQAFSTKFIVKR